MKKTVILIILIAATYAPAVSAQNESITTKLKDHYIGKPVIAKIPLPEDKQPMILNIGRDDLLDKRLYKLKLERVGVGIDTGMVGIIADVEARKNELMFVFVGVGYELPSGEVPKALLDDDVFGQGGARIRIKAGKDLKDETDLIKSVNEWLANVVNTRSLVSMDDLPDAVKEAITTGDVLTGMSRRAVYLSSGEPTEILKELKDGGIHEAWIYDREDFSCRAVLFVDGRVTRVKDY